MKDRLRADLKLALSARRSAEVAVLRMMIAAIDNKEAPPLTDNRPVQRGDTGATEVMRQRLDTLAVRAIFLSEIAEREIAMAQMEAARAAEAAGVLRAEVLLIRRYLD